MQKAQESPFKWHSSRSQKFSYYINLEKYAPNSVGMESTHKMCVFQTSDETRCFIYRLFVDPDGPGQPHSRNPYWSIFHNLPSIENTITSYRQSALLGSATYTQCQRTFVNELINQNKQESARTYQVWKKRYTFWRAISFFTINSSFWKSWMNHPIPIISCRHKNSKNLVSTYSDSPCAKQFKCMNSFNPLHDVWVGIILTYI